MLYYFDLIPIMLYYFDLIPRRNKKFDDKNTLNHDGGFK
jgi:hypothetical protein